jgi:hypothetical protein
MKALHTQDKFYDFLKHIATLSTGSIVLLTTVAEKFKSAEWKILLEYSYGALFISILSSVICAFFSISQMRREELDTDGDWERDIILSSFLITSFSFLVGLLGIGIFAIKNFSQAK